MLLQKEYEGEEMLSPPFISILRLTGLIPVRVEVERYPLCYFGLSVSPVRFLTL